MSNLNPINLETAREVPNDLADKFDELNRRQQVIIEHQKLLVKQVMDETREKLDQLSQESTEVWNELLKLLDLPEGEQYSITSGCRPAYVVNAQELAAAQARAQAEQQAQVVAEAAQ